MLDKASDVRTNCNPRVNGESTWCVKSSGTSLLSKIHEQTTRCRWDSNDGYEGPMPKGELPPSAVGDWSRDEGNCGWCNEVTMSAGNGSMGT